MTADELVALNEEIAGMARAGLPLDQGLTALAKEMGRGRLRQVTAAIAGDLQKGHTLPQALERQSDRLPQFYSSLVAAGVRTGRVADVLATLTTYARTVADLRTTVADALFYPCIVLVFGAALFIFACVVIVPRFEQIYSDFGFRLPLLTEAILLLGRRPLEYVVLPLVTLFVLLVGTRIVLAVTPGGRHLWARFVYSVPVIGTLLRAARLAAFTELLAILVDHEVPLPEAFRLAGAASSDPVMAEASKNIEREIKEGRSLGEALRGRGFVPEWVSWMAGLGERRGTLGKSLHHVAEMYRRQVEMRAGLLKNVLPPILIIGIAGIFICFFVAALMLPMIRLLEGLSK